MELLKLQFVMDEIEKIWRSVCVPCDWLKLERQQAREVEIFPSQIWQKSCGFYYYIPEQKSKVIFNPNLNDT